MSESIESVRQEIAATRARLGDTVAAIDATVHAKVDGVRSRVDPTRIAPRYPWLALAGALGAGLAIAMTGADRKAASATAAGAKRVGPATKSGLVKARTAVADRLHRGGSNVDAGYGLAAVSAAAEPGLLARLLAPVREIADQRAAELLLALWDASRDFNPSAPATPPALANGGSVVGALTATQATGAPAITPAVTPLPASRVEVESRA